MQWSVSLPKKVQGRTTGESAIVSMLPRAHWWPRGLKVRISGLIQQKSYCSTKVNPGYNRKVSGHKVLHSLLHSCRPVRMPTLTPVLCWNRLQWEWTSSNMKKLDWANELHFLHHVERWCLCVSYFGKREIAPVCTKGRRQAAGGGVMLWAVVFWGPGFHVDVT